MNSKQLINIVLPYLEIREISKVTAQDAFLILSKINNVIDDVWRTRSPSVLRRQFSAYLSDPIQVQVQILKGSKGFVLVDSLNVDDSFAGLSIQIGGDSHLNKLASPSQLAYPYLGESGEYDATIFFDAVQLDAGTKSIEPIAIYRHNGIVKRLHHTSRPELYLESDVCNEDPKVFWVENAEGINVNAAPRQILRIRGLPREAGSIEFIGEISSPILTMEDLQVGRDLPLDDQEILHISSIAIESMSTTPIWKAVEPHVLREIKEQAERSRLAMQSRISHHPVAAKIHIGTPKGY